MPVTPSTWEPEARRSLRVHEKPGLHREIKDSLCYTVRTSSISRKRQDGSFREWGHPGAISIPPKTLGSKSHAWHAPLWPTKVLWAICCVCHPDVSPKSKLAAPGSTSEGHSHGSLEQTSSWYISVSSRLQHHQLADIFLCCAEAIKAAGLHCVSCLPC